MSVTIHMPSMLRVYCGGASTLSLSAPTVREALQWLETNQPALYRCVCDETGAVRRHVNLFVNSYNIRDYEGLDMSLKPGDILTILPAVSGG